MTAKRQPQNKIVNEADMGRTSIEERKRKTEKEREDAAVAQRLQEEKDKAEIEQRALEGAKMKKRGGG